MYVKCCILGLDRCIQTYSSCNESTRCTTVLYACSCMNETCDAEKDAESAYSPWIVILKREAFWTCLYLQQYGYPSPTSFLQILAIRGQEYNQCASALVISTCTGWIIFRCWDDATGPYHRMTGKKKSISRTRCCCSEYCWVGRCQEDLHVPFGGDWRK